MSQWITLIDECFRSTVVQQIGLALFHSLWQIVVLGAAYAVLKISLRRRSASVRYIAGCITLVLMIAFPVGTCFVITNDVVDREGVEVTSVESFESSSRAFSKGSTPNEFQRKETLALDGSTGSLNDDSLLMGSSIDGTDLMEEKKSGILAFLSPYMPWGTVIWMVGVLLLSLRPLWGWLYVRRLRSQGFSPVSPSIESAGKQLVKQLKINKVVRFVCSSLVEVPAVVGYLRPVVLLPASAITGLSATELELIIAHELAHIRRHDYLVNLLQTVIEALLFFHPCMWWVSSQVRQERENCCDDMAVALCGSRSKYIHALARLEEQRSAVPVTALAATGGSLLARVKRIASMPVQTQTFHRSWMVTAIVILLVVGVIPIAIAVGRMQESEWKLDDSRAGVGRIQNQEPEGGSANLPTAIDEQINGPISKTGQKKAGKSQKQEKWGKETNGVRVGLDTEKKKWYRDEMPAFSVRLKNESEQYSIFDSMDSYYLELDGKKHILRQTTTSFPSRVNLSKGKLVQQFVNFRFHGENASSTPISIRQIRREPKTKREIWTNSYMLSEVKQELQGGLLKLENNTIKLTPGKHQIRIGVPIRNFKLAGENSKELRVLYSNLVEFEVSSKELFQEEIVVDLVKKARAAFLDAKGVQLSKLNKIVIKYIKEDQFQVGSDVFNRKELKQVLGKVTGRKNKTVDFTIEFDSVASNTIPSQEEAEEITKDFENLVIQLEFAGSTSKIVPKKNVNKNPKNANQRGSNGLHFLKGIPEFADFQIAMQESKFEKMIADRELNVTSNKVPARNTSTYMLTTASGQSVIVMFKDGRCSGIQRMRDIPINKGGQKKEKIKTPINLPDGVYRVRPAGSKEKGVKVLRNDTGEKMVLLRRLTRGFGFAAMKSVANDNSLFQIDLQSTGPYLAKSDLGHLALVVDGVCMMVSGHSDLDQKSRMNLSARCKGKRVAEKVAARLKIAPRMRKHPGHKMQVTISSVKQNLKVGEPILVKLKIKNVGDKSFSFYDGGMQRGARNNQFGFTAYRQGGAGKALADTGDPVHFGGKAVLRTIHPGSTFEKEVDLASWFTFKDSGTYQINGRFDMEFHNPKKGPYFAIWDDAATASTKLVIN